MPGLMAYRIGECPNAACLDGGLLGCFVAAFVGATGVAGLVSVAGWLQRASLAIAFAWIVMLAFSCLIERAGRDDRGAAFALAVIVDLGERVCGFSALCGVMSG